MQKQRGYSLHQSTAGELLLGNQAIARGAWEAGVRVVTAYPGTPSTEITEAAARPAAVEAGCHKSVNLVLFGILSRYLPFSPEDWSAAIAACVPPHTLNSNQRAFESGRNYAARIFKRKK